ncbi:glycoside hydrolase family 2 sugar binding protein [Emticicia oligotrophica DSM 17448]|uniref:Glycoside hydrolase family 2 sugar binding protein n=1 Tax=Emticicia oligotrophica (strain DSM 17448 / CIP 109782 / MTCC 6937 / GPTSA100-15) TaxID=929562 RepID=A0ABM5MZ71_EMTOG|nr:glycoside hydrolase family 2 [Emticicia oligotrophica]AFK02285.1 glycoside hydrolase family 2 sugar binding protein [Emticicia oligotrophica DSM 17448]
MIYTVKRLGLILLCFSLFNQSFSQEKIPLPEHPRPDFERLEWQNLNGNWAFEFDKKDEGEKAQWFKGTKPFTKTISVPFPWGSPLSGVKDEADIAWYSKKITVKPEWKGKRVFVTIGASDWKTTVWLDGKELGSHEGGYTPFSFELTNIKYGSPQNLVIRVDDKRREFTLYGKQGYGNARGLWQTIYVEARGQNFVDALHFTPDIDKKQVKVTAYLPTSPVKDLDVELTIGAGNQKVVVHEVFPKGKTEYSFVVPMPAARLWTLEDPYLYDASLKLGDDVVKSYFGMRKISTVNLPNTNYKYIALNDKPVYMQLALDQSYHPTGFYTFPTDEFMKNEILLARNIGLNGIRTHIKVDVPRKLYWADKLGVLVMSDLPNFWGEPDKNAQKESEFTLREMIKRDYNHPAIFSWITFNETWGLRTKQEINGKKQNIYLPETQKWVASVYRLAKSLDATRLVEDNSICCGAGHTETDINSWHEYLPGSGWEKHLKTIDENTYVGSQFHYEKGYLQTDVPNINSECGNVWGYEGSTGDVDWSWDYHRMINTFRKYPKIAGWLYTEHHDVINEWNGYYRFDRSEKETGVGELVDGMGIKDFHADIYLSTGNEISRSVKPKEEVTVPLYMSVMTDKNLGNSLNLKVSLYGYDALGQKKTWGSFSKTVPYAPWLQKEIESLKLTMPDEKSVVIAALVLEDNAGNVVHRNFTTFIVEGSTPTEMTLLNGKKAKLVSIEPKNFSNAQWSKKQWNVLDGLKVNGAGSGFFEYKIKVPTDAKFESASFVAEVASKQQFAKDMDKKLAGNEDYMLGAIAEPSQNKNAYPMTDTSRYPSAVSVSINGVFAGRYDLSNDPADHRGILSWHNQPQDRKLYEAGSYGYRLGVNIPQKALEVARTTGEFVVRLEVDGSLPGGLAIYGDKFGRYPMNPTILLVGN